MWRISDVVRVGTPLYYGGLRATGVPAVSRRLRDAGLILCYHNLVGTDALPFGDPGLHMPRDRFEAQIRWIAERYTVVPLRELVDRVTSGASLRAVAAVTFDDGYTGVFEHAVPILRALNIPATVFVVAEAVGCKRAFWWDRPDVVSAATPGRRREWLHTLRGDETSICSPAAGSEGRAARCPDSHLPASWETIRTAAGSGIEIGVHSATHRVLPTLTDAELGREIVRARAAIAAETGTHGEFFAYPYGLWDSRVRARIRSAGYRAALTLDAGLNRSSIDPYSLRRLNVPAGISDAAFESWTAGLPRGHGR
jgi:peptidoglycan/xylan/chitin deacetylase (PgdA/CDA1 family)